MSSYNQLLSARILSEANDLKRNMPALAKDLGLEENQLMSVLKQGSVNEIINVMHLMADVYPIDIGDLLIPRSDTQFGVKIMRLQESVETSRVFDRLDSKNKASPYYEYRDTALSVHAPFKPEWIKQIRVVSDSDPYNPDVQYNNGHFLHQATFFVGPVNFYWELDGQKYCKEMNTGDSNYITPFVPHSFTSRSKDELAYIVAVTFGGEVRRAQKALYAMGDRTLGTTLKVESSFHAYEDLLQQHLNNEWFDKESFMILCREKGIDLSGASVPDDTQLSQLADFLKVNLSDLKPPIFNKAEEVVVKHTFEDDGYDFPQSNNAFYKIKPLARTSRLKELKGFDIECLSTVALDSCLVQSSLHSYVFNYGTQPITLRVKEKEQMHELILQPSDSAYIEPFVEHLFFAQTKGAKLFVQRMSGSYNLEAQIELSYFKDKKRAVEETASWYNYD